MDKYLMDFASAFMKVNVDNYNWNALNIHQNTYVQEAENNFSSEMCRHFRNLMEKKSNVNYYTNLRCHFDVRKARLNIHPDIVVHNSPFNRDLQMIFAEVKLTDTVLLGDLNKLYVGITRLQFKHAVMIVVNKSFETTQREIREFIQNRELSDDEQHKLYLFHAVRNEDNVTASFRFYNFLSV